MPQTYVLECPPECSLGPGTPFGIQTTEMMLEGKTYRSIVAEAAKYNIVQHIGTMTRHKKHIVVTGRAVDETEMPDARYKASNIEILETIIQKGFQNAKNWKPTISDTMKAMDMWFRLTQGNPFDDLLDALASASIGEETDGPENPQAVRAVGEAPQAMFEDEEVEVPLESAV
jgi:hypothetical protein